MKETEEQLTMIKTKREAMLKAFHRDVSDQLSNTDEG